MHLKKESILKIHPSTIAFDFDGVVADTFRLFVSLAYSEFGIVIDYESITDYNFLNVVNIEESLADRLIELLTDIPHQLELMPNKGAEKTLKRLSEHSRIMLVTARPYGDPVKKWIDKTMPEIKDMITVIATGEYSAKLPFLIENKIRFFVEDRLDTCRQLAEAGITPIVYDQPWNRSSHPYKVVEDWNDIAELIEWQDIQVGQSPMNCPTLTK